MMVFMVTRCNFSEFVTIRYIGVFIFPFGYNIPHLWHNNFLVCRNTL